MAMGPCTMTLSRARTAHQNAQATTHAHTRHHKQTQRHEWLDSLTHAQLYTGLLQAQADVHEHGASAVVACPPFWAPCSPFPRSQSAISPWCEGYRGSRHPFMARTLWCGRQQARSAKQREAKICEKVSSLKFPFMEQFSLRSDGF